MDIHLTERLIERFWIKVDTSGGPDACWLWTAAKHEHGYGLMRPDGQRNGSCARAHRVSAAIAGMDIAGKKVRHTCDTPACVNPAHLLVGTQAENLQDMRDRNRAVLVGSTHPNSKLTETDVGQILWFLEKDIKHKLIAEAFGVSRPTITLIANRQTWKHVTTAIGATCTPHEAETILKIWIRDGNAVSSPVAELIARACAQAMAA